MCLDTYDIHFEAALVCVAHMELIEAQRVFSAYRVDVRELSIDIRLSYIAS